MVTKGKTRKPRRAPGDEFSVPPGPMPTGAFAKPLGRSAKRFYDGSPGREVVPCPDCSKHADALFGDHGGSCIETTRFPTPNSALGILHRAALSMRRLSMNELRAEFDARDVKPSSRGSAFTEAVRRGWLEHDGSIPSIAGSTKGHHIHVYRSLIHPAVVSVAEARDETPAERRTS